MITFKNKISVILEETNVEGTYCLFEVEILGYRKYALAIRDKAAVEFELLDGDKSRSEAFFFKAVEYGLSRIHLKDAVNDYLRENIE